MRYFTVALFVVLALSLGRATSGDDTDVLFTNSKKVLIPLKLPLSLIEKLKDVNIYVSADKAKSWKLHKTVGPTATFVSFEAPDDGLYWFALQFIDKEGKLSPAKESELMTVFKLSVHTKEPIPVKDKRDPKLVKEWEEKETRYKKQLRDYEKEIKSLKDQIRELEDRLLEATKDTTKKTTKEGKDKDKTPTDDEKLLAGTWQAVEMEALGSRVDKEVLMTIQVGFNSNLMRLVMGSKKRDFQITLHPETSPKGIDLTPLEGDLKGKTVPAIYELRGDELRLCMPFEETKIRPTEFRGPKGLGSFILQRIK